jgi:hypothetical protein
MPITNIQGLNYSDSQNELVNKLNSNFDELIELHGGIQGNLGPTGGDGSIGLAGINGKPGITGPRGTRWFVRSSQPGGTGNYSVEGDYWVEISTSKIYIFTDTGWVDTGYQLDSSNSLFRDVSYTSSGGSSGNAITENQNSPSLYTFVVEDQTPENSSLVNRNLSKFLLSTDTSLNDGALLEFSKSELEDGSISDYSSHPIISWGNFDPSNLDLNLEVPEGKFYTGASGGMSIKASDISIESYTGITFESLANVFATGGINLTSVSALISSSNLTNSLTLTSVKRCLSLTPTLTSPSPSISVNSTSSGGGTGALKTTRTADNYDDLSNSVYNVLLACDGPGGSDDRQFYINTKGKVKTKKIDGGVTYPFSGFGATSSSGTDVICWYLVARTSSPTFPLSTPKPFALNNGNVAVINPYTTAPTTFSSFCGIGIYSFTDYTWGRAGGLQNGESLRFSAYCSQNPGGASQFRGFRYIGYGRNSSTMTTVAELPFYAASVDFIISRGATGSLTSVSYLAYGSSGGSGGSFYF